MSPKPLLVDTLGPPPKTNSYRFLKYFLINFGQIWGGRDQVGC